MNININVLNFINKTCIIFKFEDIFEMKNNYNI